MGTQDLPDLAQRLEALAPASILAIGPQAAALLGDYAKTHPDVTVEYLDPHGTLAGDALLEELARRGRYAFIILRGVLERIDAEAGAHLLARLRDVHTRRLCVAIGGIDAGSSWPSESLISLGLSHWSTETVKDASLAVYGFDLGTYKSTPDWLNARHWAHPEHWGKYRW